MAKQKEYPGRWKNNSQSIDKLGTFSQNIAKMKLKTYVLYIDIIIYVFI